MKMKIIALAILLILFTKVAIAEEKVELQTVYSMDIEITKENVATLKKITAVNGTISTFPTTKQNYRMEVTSYDNKKLFEENVSVSFTILLEPVSVINLNKTTIHPRVPYYPTAKFISLYYLNDKILEIDLITEFCNNNKACNLGENQYNCPEDCKKTVKIPWVWILILVVAIIFVLIILLKMKEKTPSKLDYNSLKDKWRIS
jgi:hypothetical protein